jgi:ADP-ribose pyrophosphatase
MSNSISRDRSDIDISEQLTVYSGYLKINRYTLRFKQFDGQWSSPVVREILLKQPAVSVLIYDPKLDAVLLVEQVRLGALEDQDSPWLLECVAGLIDYDQSPEDTAMREAEEEAGCVLRQVRVLYEYYVTPGCCDEKVYACYAEADLSTVSGIHGLASENEDIRVHVVKVDQALDWLESGRINNVNTIIALQWLALQRQEN